MASSSKKLSQYFLVVFIVFVVLSVVFWDNQTVSGLSLGFAIYFGAYLLYFWLESFVLMIKKAKEDKNLWYVEKLVPEDGAIFVFGEDSRPDADEIVRSLGIIYDHGIHTFDLVIFGKKAPCAFWGNDFLCPFETSSSNTLRISNGKFYRMDNADPNKLEEFEAISFDFLSELNRSLKEYVEQLHQPF